ncbi:leucine-rich repeat domain-containing protein [Flavobacterium myungsuense]|uniref:Leucine-rich repeat domain-containing protein n=1 Tax=Flavobacterium myungsuense TaxID=651823 RepID=A0ABW3IZC7_9FLAO
MRKKVLLLFIFTTTSIFAQYTLIPDANFEQALIAQGYDSGAIDGKVLTANINKLTYLNVDVKSIFDLTGIQDFVALTNLSCNNNQLTSLNVSGLKALTFFDCSFNQLTSLNLSGLTALISLNCYYNQLTSVNLSGLKSLEYLNFNNNQLTSLNVIELTALTSFQFYNNKLTTLDVSENTALTKLNCSGNNLTTLDVSKNNLLDFLNSSYNQLTILDVSNNNMLSYLVCTNNELTKLDVSKNILLKIFNCSLNQLSILDVSNNIELINLGCSYNQLTALDVSNNIALTELFCFSNQLTYLNLKNTNNSKLTHLNFLQNPNLSCILVDNKNYADNGWQNYKDNTTSYEENCSPGFGYTLIPDVNFENKLIKLGLDNVQDGKVLTSKINTVTYLDVSSFIGGIQITDLTGIQDFIALRGLFCPYNKLTSLDVSKNTALSYLYCPYNQITSLDVSKNSALNSLICSYNQLTYLNIKNANNLNMKNDYSYSYNLDFMGNPNLSCIQVDNKYYSDNKWQFYKDYTASYQESCGGSGYTLIPDVNFENKLIELGLDGGTADGQVLTSSINTISVLDVSSSAITDLTGIQDFVALTNLNCNSNQLTTLDVSRNNLLTSFNCANNQLTSLNIKIPNYYGVTYYNFLQNPNLTCIKVYNKLWADEYWENYKDLTATYEEICPNFPEAGYTSIPDFNFESKLIALGIDTGTYDGKVLTSYINTLTSLDVSYVDGFTSSNGIITDLTGIQDFAALTSLDCGRNSLSTLDVSKNIALSNLFCYNNQLTTLDVSKNIKHRIDLSGLQRQHINYIRCK